MWPFQPLLSLSLPANLPGSEAVVRLRSMTRRCALFRGAVVGTVRPNCIVLTRFRAFTGYNPLSPQFRGRIEDVPSGGSVVVGSFRPSWFGLIWAYGIYPFIAFFLFAILVLPSAQVRPTKPTLLAGLGSMTIAWSLMLTLFRYQARNDAKFLTDHLQQGLSGGA